MTPKEKWNSLGKEKQEKILNNVWCHNCKLTKMVEYKIYKSLNGIILHGICEKCGEKVARVIELDE